MAESSIDKQFRFYIYTHTHTLFHVQMTELRALRTLCQHSFVIFFRHVVGEGRTKWQNLTLNEIIHKTNDR